MGVEPRLGAFLQSAIQMSSVEKGGVSRLERWALGQFEGTNAPGLMFKT